MPHQEGEGSKYTSTRLPVKLVYLEKYNHIYQAFLRERQIHNWSGKKKDALIHQDIRELKKLAKCRNESNSLDSSLGYARDSVGEIEDI